MRVLLKFILDCEPDAAWEALRSPAVFTDVARPFTTFESLEVGGFPRIWPEGVHPVRGRAFGIFPMGDQVIDISFPHLRNGVRVVRDSGGGLTGALALVTYWQHSMAVAPGEHGGTLYRDELRFRVGLLTPLAWPLYWAFWQWRGWRIRVLARHWQAHPGNEARTLGP
jgi:hypothetical protein